MSHMREEESISGIHTCPLLSKPVCMRPRNILTSCSGALFGRGFAGIHQVRHILRSLLRAPDPPFKAAARLGLQHHKRQTAAAAGSSGAGGSGQVHQMGNMGNKVLL